MGKVLGEYKRERPSAYNKRFGILFNGTDNYYPLIHENLINLSPTSSQCVDIRKQFLVGAGFENESLEEVNLTGRIHDIVTPNDLLYKVGKDVSKHNGAFVHIRYNANFEKVGFKLIPYNLCRIGKKDSSGYSGKIVVSPQGWAKRVKQSDCLVFDVYNPNEKVLRYQVEKAGGFSKWGGQIAFFRIDNDYDYPLSPIDGVWKYADTEAALQDFYNNTTRRGFKDVTIVRVQDSFEGITYGDLHRDEDGKVDENQYAAFNRSQNVISEVQKDLDSIFGHDNTGKALVISDDFTSDEKGEGKYRFNTLEDKSTPEKYAHFEQGASNNIRKAFGIPPQLIDMIEGKLGGTNGNELKIGEAMYNRVIANEKKKLERFFRELFRGYRTDLGDDFSIGQYSLSEDGTVEERDVSFVNSTREADE